jgi:hypothetical protein
MRPRNELAPLPKLPLLITESADEFGALRDAFEREIKPRGIIEQMYVHDICSIVWEILRLRRCKVVIINSAFRSALEHLFVQLLRDEAQALAHAWFTDKEAKTQVSEILSQFKLDESIRRGSPTPKRSGSLKHFWGVDLSIPNPSTPRRRCHRKRHPSDKRSTAA